MAIKQAYPSPICNNWITRKYFLCHQTQPNQTTFSLIKQEKIKLNLPWVYLLDMCSKTSSYFYQSFIISQHLTKKEIFKMFHKRDKYYLENMLPGINVLSVLLQFDSNILLLILKLKESGLMVTNFSRVANKTGKYFQHMNSWKIWFFFYVIVSDFFDSYHINLRFLFNRLDKPNLYIFVQPYKVDN